MSRCYFIYFVCMVHELLAYWIILHVILPSAVFFPKSAFSKNSFRDTIRVSNSLDPDQATRFVGPELGPYSLQKLSAGDTIVGKDLSINLLLYFPQKLPKFYQNCIKSAIYMYKRKFRPELFYQLIYEKKNFRSRVGDEKNK